MDGIPWAAALLDEDGVVVGTSEEWRRIAAGDPERTTFVDVGERYLDALGRRAADHADDTAGRLGIVIRRVLDGGHAAAPVDYACHTPEGLAWYRIHVTSVPGGGATVIHLPVTSEVRTKLATQSQTLGVIELDTDLQARAVDDLWARSRGVGSDEDLGDGWWEAIHPADRSGLLGLLRDVGATAGPSTDPVVTDVRFWGADGEVSARAEVSAHGNEGGTLGLLVVLRRRDSHLTGIVGTDRIGRDALTGLPDRTVLSDHLRLALGRAERDGRRVALMFLDLDGFKPVNDTHGHVVGDRLLVMVGGRLSGCLRPSDLLARHGGDEFVVVLTDVDDMQAVQEVAERMREALGRPFDLDGDLVAPLQLPGLSVSIGVATARGGEDPSTLLRRADAAMYLAKADGPGRIRTADGDVAAAGPVVDLSATMVEQAWSEGEFEVWFQPIVDLSDGRVEAVEALLRWRHPELGVLPASVFVPTAVSSGLITDLGWWSLDRAMATLPIDLGVDLYINVALSQFRDRDRLEGLIARLGNGAHRNRTVIELSEHVLNTDGLWVREAVSALRGASVRIAIDDFGAGFSSFSRLRHMPNDVLKVDDSIVRGIDRDPAAQRVLAGVLVLADALGLRVIAEGVEHTGEARVLRSLGVSLAQGYLLAPAVSAEDLGGVIARMKDTVSGLEHREG